MVRVLDLQPKGRRFDPLSGYNPVQVVCTPYLTCHQTVNLVLVKEQ